MGKEILFLSSEDLKKTLSMKEVINSMEKAFLQLFKKEAKVPLRMRLETEDEGTGALFMPVYLPHEKSLAIKSVTINKNNPKQMLPMIHALVTVFDSITGVPVAVLDGEYLTAMRTGAVSGLATDLLANENAETLAVIGAGIQGKTQCEAICEVRNIKKIFISDLDKEKCLNLKNQILKEFDIKKSNIEIIAFPPDGYLKEADIICTATSSTKPVFTDSQIKAGVHINSVGSYRPDMCEIPPETVSRSKIIVDQRKAALSEAGDIIQPLKSGIIELRHIKAELGEIIFENLKIRNSENDITFFKSVGIAVQDLAAANVAINNAIKSNYGIKLKL